MLRTLIDYIFTKVIIIAEAFMINDTLCLQTIQIINVYIIIWKTVNYNILCRMSIATFIKLQIPIRRLLKKLLLSSRRF